MDIATSISYTYWANPTGLLVWPRTAQKLIGERDEVRASPAPNSIGLHVKPVPDGQVTLSAARDH